MEPEENMSTSIEVNIYQYGNGIFNLPEKEKRYRSGVKEVKRFYVNPKDVYENSKITDKLFYFYIKYTSIPMINLFFSSIASYSRYLKENKQFIEDNYGQIGTDFYVACLIFSHLDARAVSVPINN